MKLFGEVIAVAIAAENFHLIGLIHWQGSFIDSWTLASHLFQGPRDPRRERSDLLPLYSLPC